MNSSKDCKADGCSRRAVNLGTGLCVPCYQSRLGRFCTMTGCSSPQGAEAGTYCSMHSRRVARTGGLGSVRGRDDKVTALGRVCSGCDVYKPWGAYSRDSRSATGHQAQCKECRSVKGRADHLMNTYGLTVAVWDAMLESQGGRCAICRTDTPGGTHKQWAVDHDRDTGVVGGLLCFSCNIGIGYLQHDPVILQASIVYIRKRNQLRLVERL